MEQSKSAPALDQTVEELHKALVTALGPSLEDGEPGKPYWDTSSTTFQDDFKARVDELLKSYADKRVPRGGDSQAAGNKASA